VNAGAIDEETRARIDEELDAALEKAGGDAPLVLARRGGIDGTIHTRLKEETSNALLKEGTGARAPLRTVAPDRYREFALISRGGMGVVYLTLDSELHRRVAFKMVVPDPVRKDEDSTPITPLAATPPSRQDTESARSFEELKVRFLQEAWITGAMEHPGVVPVYELGETEAGIPYYTMRYVRGERTLANAIKETKDLDARLTLIEPFLKACDTIRYAHSRGVIHRDLKPENIALGEFGEAVVLDWGLSKMQGRPDVSAARWRARIEEFRAASDLKTIAGAMGTPGYMAPEAALGESENVGIRSDVYSLGTILFEILTGRLPYRFKTFVEYAEQALKQDAPLASEVDPAVPAELSRICELALSREKEERFESVDKLASRLRRWQTEGALEREVELLMESAHRELENAGELTGNVLLWHLDRASAACTKVLHIRPGHPDAQELTAEIKRLRMRGIRERERGTRRRVLQIAGVLALAIAAIVTLIVASVLNDARADAERAIAGERLKARRSAAQAAVHRKTAEAAQKRLAGGYAGLADSLLARGRVHAAQLAAAKAL
ncbi:MAG: serine/threonine-protein kinase, partial [Planctomycetota bacterium]